jgi:hypothetical protein
MEDHKSTSSEQELVELRRQGKITEGEYEELHAAMEVRKKGEGKRRAPEAEGAKSKRKTGKWAFILMLAGFVLPAIGWGITVITVGVENEPAFVRIERIQRRADSSNTRRLRGDEQSGDRLRGVRERRWLLALVAVWGFLCVGLEICAFVLGVIAWPDVFGKATVVCLCSIVVLVIVFALLFTA